MRKIILLILISFLLSDIGYSQKLENFRNLEGEQNIIDIAFGMNDDFFLLNKNGVVKNIILDSIFQSYILRSDVKSMSVSNSSIQIALGNSVGNLFLFEKNILQYSFKAHDKLITTIRYSPSDLYLATSSLDSTIKIWFVETQELLLEINTELDLVTDMQFSLDEQLLIYSTNTGKVIVWSLKSKEIINTYQISKNWIRNIAMNPDSITFAVCGDDKKITILSFNNNDYYQLAKSHRNIITNIKFLNSNYLLSIGHDNRIVLNNINIPIDKLEQQRFQRYPKYKKYINKFSGDKYFSNLSISNEKNIVAISTYGKGVAITDYFHLFIEKPHDVNIYRVNSNLINIEKSDSVFIVNQNSCVIKGKISRPNRVKNTWLLNENKKIKLEINSNGEFTEILEIEDKGDYSIIVEDWDKNLNTVHYNFRLHIKKD